jgi:AcrR family transcriptional regulator
MPDGAAVPARSARREATRQRVLDAAREVFAERGVFGGTVEDICERAGYTRGAFYSNFADKPDLVEALIAREHARLLAHLDANFELVDGAAADVTGAAPAGAAGGRDAMRRVTAVVERLLDAVPVDRQFALIQAELEIHAIRDPEGSRAFREAEARFRERIVAYLERGLDRLGLEFAMDPATVTDAVIAVVEATAFQALLVGDGADPWAVSRQTLPVLLAGASRPRPR